MTEQQNTISDRSWATTLLLAIFLPTTHRFYAGKVGTAILFSITLGGAGIWYIIDIIMIITGGFKDIHGRPIK